MKIGITLTLTPQSVDGEKAQKLRSKVIDQDEEFIYIDLPTNKKN